MAGGDGGLKLSNMNSSKSKGKNKIASSSSKKDRKGKSIEISDQLLTARQRLHQTLSLGIKLDNENAKKWQSNDFTVSQNAIRVMSKFTGYISTEQLQHPLIKESISDMLIALEGILRSKTEAVLREAVNTAKKLINILKKSLCQYQMFGVVHCLSDLLSFQQKDVVITSAICLRFIIINIFTWKHENKQIWIIFKETKVVENIINFLLGYQQAENLQHFTEMVAFLEQILWRWSHSRYPVWSNNMLMDKLGMFCTTLELSGQIAVIRLYAALALCNDAALEFVSNKIHVVVNMVKCLEKSMHHSTKIEALKLCQLLTRSKEGCLSLTKLSCKPIIEGIVAAMGGWRESHVHRVPIDQIPLVMEACRSAQITCWPGDHHAYFWKFGIHKLLLDLILGNHRKLCKQHTLPSFEKLKEAVYDNAGGIEKFPWEILGGLAAHCKESFFSEDSFQMCDLRVLIECACLVAVDEMFIRRSSRHGSFRSCNPSENESASMAILLMVLSPCKYIATQTRNFLSDILQKNHESRDYLEYLLDFLQFIANDNHTVATDESQITLSMMDLVCYSTLPEYQHLIVKKEGVRMLLDIVKQRLNTDMHISRPDTDSHISHICSISRSKVVRCCLHHNQPLEDDDVLLLYSLQVLSQLLPLRDFFHHQKMPRVVCQKEKYAACEPQSCVGILLQILDKTFTLEIKLYASYCLSFFGFYGFPNKLGKRMDKASHDGEYADLQLLLSDHQRVGVHCVILKTRSPMLIPFEKYSFINRISHDYPEGLDSKDLEIKSSFEVRLSSHICRITLEKLLEYIYTGFCQVEDELLKPIKLLAKKCDLKYFHNLLQKKLPIWRSDVPIFELTSALSPSGHVFSDIVLEAKEAVNSWSCNVCELSMPHIHAHKIILSTSCAYIQALFRSGMQESLSQVIQIPVSWKALVKLVRWFYSGELPRLDYTCTWLNLNKEMQLDELSVYVELSWLAEFWCLDEVQKESIDVVVSCVKNNHIFPVKLIQLAMDLNQWQIVEVSVQQLAPFYQNLCDSNELESLDEVTEMLREGYVQYSQQKYDYDNNSGD